MGPESDLGERKLGLNEASPPSTLPARPAIPPLSVTGLVVTKRDLVHALRLYVPQLVDLVVLDGDLFVLRLVADSHNNGRP